MRLDRTIDDFLDYLRLTDKSLETISGYKKELGYFNKFLCEKYNMPIYLDGIDLKDLEDYLIDQKNKGYKPATRRRSIYILRSFFNYLIKNDLVEKNYPSLLDVIKVKEEEVDFLREEEFLVLVGQVRNPVVACVLKTMFYTGARISEVLSLELSHVDLVSNNIFIKNGKGNKDRTVPINKKLRRVLLDYLKRVRDLDEDNQLFFANKKTGKLSQSYVNKCIRQAKEDLGWERQISSHTLRHSFASNLVYRGASLVSVQKLLGHANLTVTSRYLHQDLDKLKETVELLD